MVTPDAMRWVLGLSFLGMAAWTLIPDKIEDEETHIAGRFGVFGATLITFFLAEMGDKTQIATVAMAAHYAAPVMVVNSENLNFVDRDDDFRLLIERIETMRGQRGYFNRGE